MWPMILKFKPYVPLLGGWGVAEIKKNYTKLNGEQFFWNME